MEDKPMTKSELRQRPVSSLKRIAKYLGLFIPRDFTK
jgi:hypothetical protein